MHIQSEKKAQINETPFHSFILLISLDQEIRSIYKQITENKKETDILLCQKQELTDRLLQFKHYVYNLQKTVAEQEHIIKELIEKERIKKGQFDQAKNTNMYQLLKKEIDALKQTQLTTENDLLTAWNKLDVAQKDLNDQQQNYTIKIEELHQHIAMKQQEIITLTAQLECKKEERPKKEMNVPQEWLNKYLHMRLQVDDPVVPVMQRGCSACFYSITDQELLRLKRRAIVQCKGCFRLLFMQEAMKNDTSTEDSIHL